MIISKIEVQKKNKARYSLYVDDAFLCGVTEDTLIRFSISKGKDFSDAQLQEIINHDQVMLCLNQSYRFLSRRPHLKAELKRKLKTKTFENHIIDQAFEVLYDKKYLDDRDFIKRFIQEEIRLKKSGPLLIKKKLYEKGAPAADTDALLLSEYPAEEQIENAVHLFHKKINSIDKTDPLKARQKLSRFLQQKGYDFGISQQIINDGLKNDALDGGDM